MPSANSFEVYEVFIGSVFRPLMTASNAKRTSSRSFSSPKHVSVPLWQTGPDGLAQIKTVSLSQSSRILSTVRKLPLVSPFAHKLFRDREKKVTFPVAWVSSNDSAFIKPS